ncbi:hypothetical protein M758_6G157600 [Ceratodon purpureus]|nr:hypothetical protein M758_6G157600 [Ceratodon purpureus]KAG0614188.1 hypothetical protein M758_6G157600 [Ceratodon purpureus]KAG0614189.1 hypothetical protein M758_6G157600 [Ceratodon purpureus]
MSNDVQVLENEETEDEPRILLENPETDDDKCLPASDESGLDDEAALDIQNVQLDEAERAVSERLSSGPCKRAKFVPGDSHIATQPYFGMPTLDGLFASTHNEQETLAMQAQVTGGRVTARRVPLRQPEKEAKPHETSDESPLFNSCFKVLCDMTEGAYREKCPDLLEFLTEELGQVQKRFKMLVKVGSDAGYGSPEFKRAVEVWRNSLDKARDSVYPAEQAKNVWGAVTSEKTVERVRNPRPEEPEPTTTRKSKKRKCPDPPLVVDVYRQPCERLPQESEHVQRRVDVYRQPCERLPEDSEHVQRRSGACRQPCERLPEVPENVQTRVDAYKQPCERLPDDSEHVQKRVDVYRQPCERLLEDSEDVQRRQQALFRAELSAALRSPTRKVELVIDVLSKRIRTGGGYSIGRDSSLIPMPQMVPTPVSSTRSPFTPNQWVEFEHQSLIFKYMVAGVRLMNVNNEILDPIRKSVPSRNESVPSTNESIPSTNESIPSTNESVPSSNGAASHHAPNVASGAFHLGLESEPGRCRRTDGKKWRCARDVVPEQKYCERHMHRGRHRSKPAPSSGQLQIQAASQ